MIIAEGTNTFNNDINLAVCIFPPELCTSESLAEYMIEYTRFYANRFIWISSKVDIVDSKSIDDGMLLYGEKYDHILFMAAGVRIYDSSIIVDVGNVARNNPKYLAAAHILDWEAEESKALWYELHHQFVLINTKNWRSIDKPYFGMWSDPWFIPATEIGSNDAYDTTREHSSEDSIIETGNTLALRDHPLGRVTHKNATVNDWDQSKPLWIWVQHERWFTKVEWPYFKQCMAHPSKDKTLPVVERSKENFHDNYTPLWIKNTGKREKIPDGLFLSPGSNLIDAAYNNDMEIINWDKNVRSKRTYYYPEEQSNELWYSIQDKVISDKITNFNQKQFLDMVVNGIGDQIWVLNSEYMHIENYQHDGSYRHHHHKFDQIVLPCSGFKFLDCWKSDAFTDNGKLILYDYNVPSIQWLQHVHTSTSTNIDQLIKDFPDWKKLKWFGSKGGDPLQSAIFRRGWANTEHFFGGETKMWNYIQQFREMDVQFEQVDLIQDPDKIFKIIGDQNTLLHISNIFSTDYIIAAYGLVKAQQLFDLFYSNLNSNTICTGHSPSGEWKGTFKNRFIS